MKVWGLAATTQVSWDGNALLSSDFKTDLYKPWGKFTSSHSFKKIFPFYIALFNFIYLIEAFKSDFAWNLYQRIDSQ